MSDINMAQYFFKMMKDDTIEVDSELVKNLKVFVGDLMEYDYTQHKIVHDQPCFSDMLYVFHDRMLYFVSKTRNHELKDSFEKIEQEVWNYFLLVSNYEKLILQANCFQPSEA
jgi:hypothetical protein